ncbi:helix-turn-helix domain-containing protein [Halalkaliarchaeum sp. AArc-GB]|uniref:helix-turn-helix domain-containing protein n=1 Tax=Halalkaliarchaeum sp. AArc-GB TaxID=3074078 RepID=UPI0028556A93|nr:helix-turn-helix domain-containing protein [Halalkaliarchaeum sp. AArc-GB]MDR5674369.1 helix-turn-helix domain-containing protein [Halalkaliarchaeum sp. AArc-GB]
MESRRPPKIMQKNIRKSGSKRSKRTLVVELALEFGSATKSCAVCSDCCLEKPIEHHVIDGTCYYTCQSGDSDTEIIQGRVEIDSECACRVLAHHDCIPSLQSVDSERMVVRTNPQNRTVLRELIADLDDVVDEVRLRSLVVGGEQTSSSSALVNLQELTTLERETVEKAILMGYYDKSGGAKFDELASELDITTSALSKRLSSAEGKIMRNLYSNE